MINIDLSEESWNALADKLKPIAPETATYIEETVRDALPEPERERIIEEARDIYGDAGNVEIDDNAIISRCEDGVFVQAWVRVPASNEDK